MWYAVYETSTGDLKGEGSQVPSDADLAARGFAKKEYPAKVEGFLWSTVTLDYDVVAPVVLPKLPSENFLLRLTLQEHSDLLSAASSNFTIAAWVDRVRMKRGVKQDDVEIKFGLSRMVQVGILTQARADEIGAWV